MYPRLSAGHGHDDLTCRVSGTLANNRTRPCCTGPGALTRPGNRTRPCCTSRDTLTRPGNRTGYNPIVAGVSPGLPGNEHCGRHRGPASARLGDSRSPLPDPHPHSAGASSGGEVDIGTTVEAGLHRVSGRLQIDCIGVGHLNHYMGVADRPGSPAAGKPLHSVQGSGEPTGVRLSSGHSTAQSVQGDCSYLHPARSQPGTRPAIRFNPAAPEPGRGVDVNLAHPP